jgi:multidrug efflux pump subunit AcrA (membrane-fusion protein)
MDLKAGEEVQLPADPPVTATLSYVSAAMNSDDGTVSAWAAMPPDSSLHPGQLVQLKIVTATHTHCLAAPAESIVTDDRGNTTVALVDGDHADQTPVQTGISENGWTEIQTTNLNAGDKVVTVGAYGLADKTQIQIQNPADETSGTNSADAQ